MENKKFVLKEWAVEDSTIKHYSIVEHKYADTPAICAIASFYIVEGEEHSEIKKKGIEAFLNAVNS